jgi:hypothetical protein
VDVQSLHKDPLVEVRQVWHQTCKSIPQTKEYTYADSIIKNGKKQPRKIERTKGQDGASQLAIRLLVKFTITEISVQT